MGYFDFVDLEKAFDRVPREVVKWALRKEGVEEWLIKTVMYTYVDARTAVRVGNGLSEDFEVKVGVHQGCSAQPFAFYYCDASNNKTCGYRITMGAAICR